MIVAKCIALRCARFDTIVLRKHKHSCRPHPLLFDSRQYLGSSLHSLSQPPASHLANLLFPVPLAQNVCAESESLQSAPGSCSRCFLPTSARRSPPSVGSRTTDSPGCPATRWPLRSFNLRVAVSFPVYENHACGGSHSTCLESPQQTADIDLSISAVCLDKSTLWLIRPMSSVKTPTGRVKLRGVRIIEWAYDYSVHIYSIKNIYNSHFIHWYDYFSTLKNNIDSILAIFPWGSQRWSLFSEWNQWFLNFFHPPSVFLFGLPGPGCFTAADRREQTVSFPVLKTTRAPGL